MEQSLFIFPYYYYRTWTVSGVVLLSIAVGIAALVTVTMCTCCQDQFLNIRVNLFANIIVSFKKGAIFYSLREVPGKLAAY